MFSRLRSILERRNGQRGETTVRKKEAGPRSHWKTWRIRWTWGRRRTTGEAPSQHFTFTEQNRQMEKSEELTFELQHKKYEQIELRTILASYTKKNLNNRLNSFEMMKKDHKQVMSDLQKLPLEISDALNKCKQLTEEKESYSYLHSLILRDLTQVKNNVHELRMEKRQLWQEQTALRETCEEVKNLFKEVQEKICVPCAEQHQEVENLDERLKNLLKQKELIAQKRALAEKMEHLFSVLEIRSKNLQSELEPASAQDESLLQTELLQQEH
ncbi:disks large homolog 5-like [Mesocricetus auratus]|uniref:Disks large homolog 5-like n=1 Tax=Mesocricetus auratus TaxID=10036 RepID=A0ABM2X198_MESAU|nr:disks large homolog 5-like [Mesocricetus auratus]